MSGSSGLQHRAVLTTAPTVVDAESRPVSGPIAILPVARPDFVAAVEAGGGTVEPLSAATRGLVWLSYSRADELGEVLRENPQIEWVQLPWAGVDAFAGPLSEHASKPKPLWTSAKGAYAQPVAEHALAFTLALLRGLPERARARSWGEKFGVSLYGKEVVIVGAGGIARELIRLLEPFGVTITVVRRTQSPVEGAAVTVTADRLREVLPGAAVVVIAAAATEDTRALIGAAELATMNSDAVLVNVARGALVDTDALVAALAEGRIAGAALDVTDPEPLPDGHPLWVEPRALITPHTADTPEMTEPLLAERVRLNVTAFLGDGRFVGVVDPAIGY